MAENFDYAAISNLLCDESSLGCFDDDDLDCTALNEFCISPVRIRNNVNKDDQTHCYKHHGFETNRSNSFMGFPLESCERVKEMVEKEKTHLPRHDYLKRLRTGDLGLSFRTEAIDWIWKACAYFQYGPLSVCLAVNYLDRFLSVYQFPKDEVWTMQLLAVACLSVAAKIEETKVPQSVDLQVGNPKFLFEAVTIQRMEILIMSTLDWILQVVTPYSFIDYFLSKLFDDQCPSDDLIATSVQVILRTTKGVDFMEFKPSEIALAAAISVSMELKAIDIDKANPCFIHLDKERVMKCVELMKDLSLINGSSLLSSSTTSVGPPRSPNGVLDAAVCLSYNNLNNVVVVVGSCPNVSSSPNNNNQDIKRRKQQDNTYTTTTTTKTTTTTTTTTATSRTTSHEI